MKPVVIGILALIVVGGGLTAFFLLSGDGEEDTTSAISGDRAEIPQGVLEKRGPRSSDERLRGGAKQVETPDDARNAALISLDRVEKEISQTTDKVELEKLEQKKTLIQNAIDRFGQ